MNAMADPSKAVFDPLNVDFDVSEDAINRVVANERAGNSVAINRGLEANPDDAAESIDLSDITGLPAPHVLNNLDEVKDTVRRRTAQELVLNNPELITYLQAHPMAASVSNDDWGNLDKFSADAEPTARLMKALNPFGTAVDTVDAALKAFQENSQTDIPGALTEAQKAADYLVPSAHGGGVTAHAAVFGAAAAGELLLQTMSALASGASAAAGAGTQTYLQSLEDRTGGKFGQGLGLGSPEQAGREASSLVEWQMQRGDLPLAPHGGEAPSGVTGAGRASPFGEAMAKAAPWVENGIEPPVGVHPLIDEAKAKINAGMLESMERDLGNAQASLTKGRSPELFQKFVDQHFGDSAFDINSDAVLGLYGDKPPTPDDGLLGWVPGIDAQLAAARDIGTPITVKMSDWLARVRPAVGKSLRDDIRMWPGGITANEAKVPIPPHEVVDAPIAQVRDASGLEPKFSMGDRKLTLMKGQASGEAADTILGRMDDYTIHDEHGKPVGELRIGRGDDKELLVDWIGGQAGLWANNFGPSLMRDLKRQLKALYPDYEYLTGYRVSGARYGPAQTVGGVIETAIPRVKLDVSDGPSGWSEIEGDHQKMQDIFQNGWRKFNDRIDVNQQAADFYTPEQIQVASIAQEELAKMTGGRVGFKGAAGIRTQEGQTVRGLYMPSRSAPPTALLDLLGPDVVGTTRHEGIHFLRGYDFFSPGEWTTLVSHAQIEGWLDRYDINNRYAHLDREAQFEESIAEGFREWAAQAPEARPRTGVGVVFQKIWDFLDSVRQKFGLVTGKELSWEQLFQKSKSGEIAKREPGEGPPGAFDLREKASIEGQSSLELTPAERKHFEEMMGDHYDLKDEVPSIKLEGNSLSWDPQHTGALFNWLDDSRTLRGKGERLPPSFYSQSRLIKRMKNVPDSFKVEGLDPKFSIEGDDNLRAQAVGLPVESFRQLQDAYRKQHEADLRAAQTRAEKDQTRRQSKEWRANRADMAKEVSAEINQRPDITADAFIGSGELGGKKLQQRFTLRAGDLTPEQQAVLPGHYVSTHGLPADSVAGMFGYGSKAELVDALAKVNAMRQAATGDRLGKGDFMRQLVQGETDRRMELRYGHLDENIMDAAQDQALSDASMNVMHEELTAQAMKAGVTVFDKEVMQSAAKDLVNEQPIGKVNSYKLMQLMGKHSRDAQKALLDGDAAGAAVAMQKQTVTAYAAKEAKAVEKEVAQFDKLAKRMSKREIPSMEPEYTNWVHQILNRVGKRIQRTPEDLAREIDATGTTSLQDFVDEKTSYGQIMPVWDQLFDGAWSRGYKDLQVPEFRNVRDSVKTIIHNGREERKLINAGNEADAAAIKTQLVDNLQQFPERAFDIEGEVNKPGLLRHTWARLLTVETILNRWDKFNWKGAWQQSFFRPLSEGANQLAAWEKVMGKTIREITNRQSMTEHVPNTLFRDPIQGTFPTMTRENLRTVMLNMGTTSNMEKLTRGWSLPKFDYKVTEDMVRAWVDQHATKEDWDAVQGTWDALKKPRDWSDTMYRSMSEVPMQGIEARAINTPHGRYEGGYYPVIFHPEYEGRSAKLSGISMEGLFGSGYSTGFAPDATYRIERTDYQAPLAMTMDQLPGKIRQQLRDAALRPALANASKILRDPQVRDAIKSRYGTEYHDMLKEYLRRLAGTENRGGPQSQFTSIAGRVLTIARQDLIGDLVGFNPGTVEKHGATAFMLSAKEVGPVNMMRAMKQLYEINDETGQTWRKFAYENSQELQRRDRNWQDNLYGSLEDWRADTTAKRAFHWSREQMLYWGSKPVAMADALSSEPTWLAAYTQERGVGGSHGDGIAAGDRAVRRAHGSTSDAAKPMIMSHLSPWVTSLYNFFNDILNRAVETMWRAGEMVGEAKAGNWAAAGKLAPGVAAGVFVTAIWPAIVENMVSPLESEPGDSTTKRVLKGSVHSIAAMFPVIRDFASYVTGGNSPDVGLFTTEFKAIGEAWKDLGKKAPFNPPHAQKLIRDFGTMTGALVGAPGMQIGRELGFAYGLNAGIEHPRGPWGWMVGGRFGTIKGHSPTLDDYMAGRSLPAR